MKPKSIAIVGAAETTELGRIPSLSQIGLHVTLDPVELRPYRVSHD